MEVNYFGTLQAIRSVSPSMMERRQGTIVGVSSAAGLLGVFGYTAYSPTKFAVRGLLECLRAEMTPYNVGVHCVFAGDVDTPQLEYENKIKPPETAAVSGTISVLPPDRVAQAIVKGISRRRFAITPDGQTRVLAKSVSLINGWLNWEADRRVRNLQANHSTSSRP
jgi:3-dehydrosphinganine reductase